MVAIRWVSVVGRGHWNGAGATWESETGGVLVCKGPDAWNRGMTEMVEDDGGLKILTEADSRLLSSSAFCANIYTIYQFFNIKCLLFTFSHLVLTLGKKSDLVFNSYCWSSFLS